MKQNGYVTWETNESDKKFMYNCGFWQGVFLSLMGSGVIVLGSLYYLGAFR